MYSSSDFTHNGREGFQIEIPKDREYRILQLTDFHFGFSMFSRKKDAKGMAAVTKAIADAKPDLIIITGDSIFPYIPKSGSMNNRMQCRKLLEFLDSFEVPYAFVIGNHDTELGSFLNRSELADMMAGGRYAIMEKGPESIFGVGNYFIDLTRDKLPQVSCVLLDSNMYGGGWFYGGFDCIHADQTAWVMEQLKKRRLLNPKMYAMAFYHMPVGEFKEAYRAMKLGDKSVTYNFGSVGEEEDYFGISKFEGNFFEEALKEGSIKAMFCGHDHYNTLSLTYKGIMMTYGMSIDCLGYKGIYNKEIQRGGTLITIEKDLSFDVRPLPFTDVVTSRVRGKKA